MFNTTNERVVDNNLRVYESHLHYFPRPSNNSLALKLARSPSPKAKMATSKRKVEWSFQTAVLRIFYSSLCVVVWFAYKVTQTIFNSDWNASLQIEGEDSNITFEDQQQINTFARKSARIQELKDEIEEKKVKRERNVSIDKQETIFFSSP